MKGYTNIMEDNDYYDVMSDEELRFYGIMLGGADD